MDESDAEASETDPLVTSPQPKPPPRPPKPPPRPPKTEKQKDVGKNKESKKEEKKENDSKQDTMKKESKVSFERSKDPVMEEVHLPQNKNQFDESSAVLCPFFGVKNYLHYFYETQDSKNPILLVEGKDEAFLMKHHTYMCSSSIFKLSLCIGGFILLVGTVAFIVAMCSSRKATMMGDVGGVHFVDQLSATHNAEMDALLLVSLVAVTLGATVVAAALISRTFCSQPDYEEALRLGLLSLYKQQSIVQNVDGLVPATVERTPIQPWLGHCKNHHRNCCP